MSLAAATAVIAFDQPSHGIDERTRGSLLRGNSVGLRQVGKACRVMDQDPALVQIEDSPFAELREGATDGFQPEPEIFGDMASLHRKEQWSGLHCVLAIRDAQLAKEVGQPFLRSQLPDRRHMVTDMTKRVFKGYLYRIGNIAMFSNEQVKAPTIERAGPDFRYRLAVERILARRLKVAANLPWEKKTQNLSPSVRERSGDRNYARSQLEDRRQRIACAKQKLPALPGLLNPELEQIPLSFEFERSADV